MLSLLYVQRCSSSRRSSRRFLSREPCRDRRILRCLPGKHSVKTCFFLAAHFVLTALLCCTCSQLPCSEGLLPCGSAGLSWLPTPSPAAAAAAAALVCCLCRNKRCNCKKSQCLKLYCDCFSAQVYCQGCACASCRNTPAHAALVMEKQVQIKNRDPLVSCCQLPGSCCCSATFAIASLAVAARHFFIFDCCCTR